MEYKFDKTWTLFLDRDGVINTRLIDDYVKSLNEFEFVEGVPQAIAQFTKIFGRIVVVSNQQGIGKGLMTKEMLDTIHNHLCEEVEKAGGKIDKIYYCPHLKKDRSILRKPNIGMGLLARKDFPEIRFKKSLMVGDSISDMEFGKKLKMKTVFIAPDCTEIKHHPHLIDGCEKTLKILADKM